MPATVKPTKVLVVDDEADLCRLMQITLNKMNLSCDIAYTLDSALNYLKDTSYQLCLTDLRLPDGSGLDLVKRISETCTTPVAVITAHGSMDLAIEALKLGAFDFVNKPLELPKLRQLVENALKVSQADSQTDTPCQNIKQTQLLNHRLIGQSAAINQLKQTIVKLSRSQAPVFLWGESGTGKEVVAKLIHDLSPRSEAAFVPVNCGAIPSELMESEFFGHKKGSFTGATSDKLGLFQQAQGGTLFLDEVADLPLPMQVKLLRAIQEKSVRAIGDTKEVPVDVRILSATHKDLNQLVQSGQFRQDLFYRINVIELKLPTLNERHGDIVLLAKHFLAQIAADWQLDDDLQLSQQAYQALQCYDFDGNVRELRNILERAVTLADNHLIEVAHLGLNSSSAQSSLPEVHDFNIANATTLQTSSPAVASTRTAAKQTAEDVSTTTANPLPLSTPQQSGDSLTNQSSDVQKNNSTISDSQSSEDTATTDIANSQNTTIMLPKQGLEAYLQQQEKQLILAALQQAGGNKTHAAKLLGMSFRSLRYRMKKLEID